jgi:hypothetical protein
VNLDSGLIDTRDGELRDDGRPDRWVVNHCPPGVWVIDGDVVDEIYDYEAAGNWVVCPEEDCRGEISPRGTLMAEYDTLEYPGDTKVWIDQDLAKAWAPSPMNGATDVPSIGTVLCWCPGEGAKVHHVWFGSDCDLVEARDPSTYQGTVHPGEELCLSRPALSVHNLLLGN